MCCAAQWVDDKIHGKGKSRYANGNVYDGEVSTGMCVGEGIPLALMACVLFNVQRLPVRPLHARPPPLFPQWDNGRISGHGTLVYTDGDR